MSDPMETPEPDEKPSVPPRPPSRWRLKWLKLLTGTNVLLALVLAACFAVLVNYLVTLFPLHYDVSWRQYYSLSDKTRSLLATLDVPVRIFVFLQKGHAMHSDVHHLLDAYAYEAGKHSRSDFRVEFVDPDRELVRTRELKQTYDLQDANVIVLDVKGRRQYLTANELSAYDRTFNGNEIIKRRTDFMGELVISSALQGLIQAGSPVIYFLGGHGERSIESFDEQGGFSELARLMRRDNLELRPLNLARDRDVPPDAAALVAAGPTRPFSEKELEVLGAYLDKGGRLLALLDAGTETGLDTLLLNWGIRLGNEVVVGGTFADRELVVANYGQHPITRRLSGFFTTFFLPRLIESAATTGARSPDRPRVTPIALTTAEGWAETGWKEGEPRFDPDMDRRGPVPVAVASERGAVGRVDAQLKPSRLVVIGDSFFVANGGLAASPSNLDLLLNSLNWLVSREELMAIGPRSPGVIRPQMTQRQYNMAFATIVLVIPGCIALIGAGVWLGRRS